MFCSSSSSEASRSGSSLTLQSKLKRIWQRIRYSNFLLASLIDIDDGIKGINGRTFIADEIQVETENIMKELGAPIKLQLLRVTHKFYIHLFSENANIWSRLRSNDDDEEAVNITIEPEEEEVLLNTSTLDSDKSDTFEQSTLKPKNWPGTVYSTVRAALENFCIAPRYSKEVCALYSPLSTIDRTLSISDGEVLCIKKYRSAALGCVTSFYHFGVYVGKMTTKDGRNLSDAVIELVKDHTTQDISINAVPLVGTEKGACFVLEKTENGRPSLLFKAKYRGRTQEQKNETAVRALGIYENSREYQKKYSTVKNNCEHFVNICAFGTAYCQQSVQMIITTTSNISKGFSALPLPVRYVLMAVAELSEISCKLSQILSTGFGESVALAMLIAECSVTIFWDIYLLKHTNRLTRANIVHVLKLRFLPMAPELLVAVGFLLFGILCTVSGPVGIAIGISGVILLLIMRFTTRPRIQRWLEQREVARQEDFLQWQPHEVARLAREVSEEDEPHDDLIINFERRKLSGQAIADIINQGRNNSAENHLENALNFLDSTRLDKFKRNLKVIFGHFDVSEQLKSTIELSYGEHLLNIDTYDSPTMTTRQILDMARLNWNTNFVKGHWQLSMINPEDGKKSVVASYAMEKSIMRKITAIPDSTTKIELSYVRSDECQIL
ncbi:unnamed protein product [Rotaria socialis]|uniref:LRAT domain-containing protein n=1 Tax=Rotaria socialis TaxID=392032 RepID=A0A819Y847_9BILA|nr:unnamed protein product [Rotaria socialis]CAF3349947.1 unnamed protein product [Rotaria socialis]CAF3367174.1 unnamed protein product [Rotaria socialis]CAF3544000.1 unnamed protein product [Rotaria socialis]CAF4153940.1 unnamed protein product [Rotaria socialis]